MKKSILIIRSSYFTSGAEYSLLDLLNKIDCRIVYTKSNKTCANKEILGAKTYELSFIWFVNTINPFVLIRYLYHLVISTIKLLIIIKNNNLQVIYTNSIKSAIYGLSLKLLTNKKLVCHVRDNINSDRLKKLLIRKSDALISISKHINNQFPNDLKINHLIYGGIDTNYWKSNGINKVENDAGNGKIYPYPFNLKPEQLVDNPIYIACIGQVTRWKNQIDFIKAAKLLLEKNPNVIFLIIGDDLSGGEKKYKKELLGFVKGHNLQERIQFLGFREDIKDVMNSVDIVVHTAINEPFGRVLIEAMAFKKPIVAYNCGGPAEIILDAETGFLVEPYNIQQLSEKILKLVENEELRSNMGNAGRQRVIEKFNIERYVKEMEEVFDNL